MQSKLGTLEVPDHATTHKIIMLATLASWSEREVRRPRPKVTGIQAETEAVEAVLKWIHIQTKSHLKHAGSRGTTGVRAVVQQI
jgi:hypothetical protein